MTARMPSAGTAPDETAEPAARAAPRVPSSVAASPAAAPPAAAPQPAALTVHTSFDDVGAAEWDAFAASQGTSVFLSHAHAAIWWSHYGSGRALRLLVFRAEGAIVGILPMFVERVFLGPAGIRRAAIVGSDSTLVLLDPPVDPGRAAEILASALRHLLGAERCDAVRFAPLPGTWPHHAALREAAASLAEAVVVRDAEIAPHVVFPLPATHDAYLAALGKKRRAGHRSGMKTLRAAYETRTDVISDAEGLADEFPRFEALHDRQWAAEGKLGHFRDWPGSAAMHRELIRTHAAAGRAHLVRIVVDREPVSYQLCYSHGTTLHWILPARSLRPEFERLSLGRLGLVEMIAFAIGSGFTTIEAGVGRYEYKLQLGGTEHAARSVVVASRRPAARLRLAVFTALAVALDAVYYRLWFKRIAPRLGLPLRPLWKRWMRTRP